MLCTLCIFVIMHTSSSSAAGVHGLHPRPEYASGLLGPTTRARFVTFRIQSPLALLRKPSRHLARERPTLSFPRCKT